jgi:hypothetical protein
MATPSDNPFDAPLASEMQEHTQAQAATQAASSNGNPFEEPLASEKAQQALLANPGAEIQPVTTATNPKLAAAEAGKDMPEYVGATGALAAGAMGSAIVEPAISNVIAHIGGLDKIVKAAKTLGYASFGLKEAHDLYKALTSESKK